jgi:protein-tyrosine phosphatase
VAVVKLESGAVSSGFVTDAGGLRVAGGTVRTGHLMRVSGDLVALAELRRLTDLGVGTYVDLRGDEEDRERLRRWARRAGVDYVAVPIDVAGGRDLLRRIALGGGQSRGVDELYRTIVDEHGAQLARAAEIIAEGAPVAFGCAAGKDRTGVLAALVQSSLGAQDADVAASYVASAPTVDALSARLRDEYDAPSWVLNLPGTRALLGATQETILSVLAHLRREHGSAEGYFRAHGLPAASVTRLREAVVA